MVVVILMCEGCNLYFSGCETFRFKYVIRENAEWASLRSTSSSRREVREIRKVRVSLSGFRYESCQRTLKYVICRL